MGVPVIRMVLVEPSQLPRRTPVIVVHRKDRVLFVVRKGVTAEQLERWITILGASITREAADAAVVRSKAAAKPKVRLRKVPRVLPHAGAKGH